METQTDYTRQTYSYMALRKAVGWIGILLPFVLMLGAFLLLEEPVIRESISHYYHSGMGDVFVGAICAVALFLFYYCGHDLYDNTIATIAGAFAIGVALFPTTEFGGATGSGIIHLICAASFFVVLAIFSLFIFTKKSVNPTPEKLTRNKIYKACGTIIVACIIAIAIYKLFFDIKSSFVFWAETIALVAFGFSWLTKGEAIFGDKQIVEENPESS